MQVRSLSATSFWIEMPFSPLTPRLIWRAMAHCGLVSGKINSYEAFHFAPEFSGGDHIVEGRTPHGFFAMNMRVQAHLEPEGGGTRVRLEAVPLVGQFDFGAASRFKRRCAASMQEFLRSTPADWDEAVEATSGHQPPPIASPSDETPYYSFTEAELTPRIVPIQCTLTQWQWSFWLICLYIVFRFQFIVPLLLCLTIWQWKSGSQPRKWWEYVLLLGFGGYATLRLLARLF